VELEKFRKLKFARSSARR